MTHVSQEVFDAVLRSDLSSFTRKVFTYLNPGTAYCNNWHLAVLGNRLERAWAGEITRLIINLPPRSLKSILASVAWPAFILDHDPSARIINVSYSQQLASGLARDCRRVLEADWYKRLFPGIDLTKVTEDLIETSKGGGRRATSIDGSITGFGARYIIVDDPMSASAAASETEREKVKRFYTDSLFSRLDDKINGRIVVVMQRLHSDDLTGHLLATAPASWSHVCLPAIAREEERIAIDGSRFHIRRVGDLLHPEREPLAALEEARRNLGSMQFEAQYQQAPVPDTGNLIQRNWFKHWQTLPPLSEGRIIQSWDTAYRDDPSCDWSVCTTWLLWRGQHYLFDLYRQRRNFPDLLKDAAAQYWKHKPHAVLIEDQGTGTTMIQTLKAEHHIPAIARKSKDDKKTRLVSVLPMIEAGHVHPPHQTPWLAELLGELCGFPATRHDDQVDSVSQYLIWAREDQRRIGFEYDMGHDEPLGSPDAAFIAALRLGRGHH